jgi:subtilisin family serine protease
MLCAALALLAPASAAATVPARDPLRVIVALDAPAIAAAAGDVRAEQQATARAQDALLASAKRRGARELARTRSLPFLVLEIDRAALADLARDPRVAALEEDRLARPALGASAALVGAPQAWAGGYTGAGQAVVVLDTGVELDHPFLRVALVDGACFSSAGTGAIPSESLCPDGSMEQQGLAAGAACPALVFGCDHGTHVAGIAAGRDAGVTFSGIAPGATLVSVQVYSRFSGDVCRGLPSPCALSWSSDQLRALDWVYTTLRHRLDVAAVNLSLAAGALAAPCDAEYPAVKLAIDQLRAAGIATVAAAGNSGAASGLGAPACVSSAVAVGATTLDDTVASFSNSAASLALLAPGSAIQSSVPGQAYGVRSGTSMAAPHVSGALAVLRAARPTATLEELLQALAATGRPVTDARNGLVRPRIRLDAALDLLSGPAAGLALSSDALSFGEQELGVASAARIVVVANPHATPLALEQIAVSGDFARAGGTCPAAPGTLPPASNCTVAVVFTPTAIGARDGALTISSGPAAPVQVRLSGSGLAPIHPRVYLPAVAGG